MRRLMEVEMKTSNKRPDGSGRSPGALTGDELSVREASIDRENQRRASLSSLAENGTTERVTLSTGRSAVLGRADSRSALNRSFSHHSIREREASFSWTFCPSACNKETK